MFPEGRALEFLLAAVVALVVVGPKDLPVLMRKLGQFMGKMRAMAAEFRASFDEMARQSELDELRKEVEAMRRAQFADAASAASEAQDAFDGIRHELNDAGANLNEPPPPYYASVYEATPEPAPKPRAPHKATSRASAGKASAKPAARPRKKKPEAEA